MIDFTEQHEKIAQEINERLLELIRSGSFEPTLAQAMEYSLCDGGKRIRPVLLIETYMACDGDNRAAAIDFACAVEMIHTYSLIHDDLPCMDDDDFRRGKPSSHKKFGEDVAVLAGDALLTYAFEVMANVCGVCNKNIVKAIGIVAKCAGPSGMVGGQIIDITQKNVNVSVARLIELHTKKTAQLLCGSLCAGATLAGASDEDILQIESYGLNLGLAFQIKDDILDVVGDPQVTGKPSGSDANQGKITFIDKFGVKESELFLKKHTQQAIDALVKTKGNFEFHKWIANNMQSRKK